MFQFYTAKQLEVILPEIIFSITDSKGQIYNGSNWARALPSNFQISCYKKNVEESMRYTLVGDMGQSETPIRIRYAEFNDFLKKVKKAKNYFLLDKEMDAAACIRFILVQYANFNRSKHDYSAWISFSILDDRDFIIPDGFLQDGTEVDSVYSIMLFQEMLDLNA